MQVSQKKKSKFLLSVLKALVLTAFNTLIFYVLFKIAIWVISNFHKWNNNLQRGITWEYYILTFAIAVFFGSLIFLFSTKRAFKNIIIRNALILVVLIIIFFKSLYYIPYSIYLAHTIALIVLLFIPIILSKLFKEDKYIKYLNW
jgi:hypothetical protein